jgi:hypothetical protein
MHGQFDGGGARAGGRGRGGGGEGGGIELIRYRGTAGAAGESGGLLRLAVDLAPAAEAVEAAGAELAARFGVEPNLVPVVFDRGGVRLVALGVAGPAAAPTGEAEAGDAALPPTQAPAAPRLVEQVVGTAAPSLFHHQRALFAARLTPAGSVLTEAALSGAAPPLLVVYDLAFSGLAPARGLRAEVDYRMAYDYLRARAAADTLWFRADLDREAEALAREGHVRIEDVDYRGSDPAVLAERQREVEATLRELTESLFFRPAASPATPAANAATAPPPAAGGGSGAPPVDPAVDAAWRAQGAPRAAFVMRAMAQQEEQTLTYDLSVASVLSRRIAPQGAVALPAGATGWLREVSLEGPETDVGFEAFSLPDADWRGIDAVQIDLRSGAEERSLVLSEEAPRASAVLPAGPLEQRLRVLARPEPDDLGEPPSSPGDFAPAAERHLLVEPETAAGRRRVRIALGPGGPPVARVEGRVGDGRRSRALLLDATRPEVEVAVWGGADLTLDGRLVLAAGGSVAMERAIGSAETLVLLAPSPAPPGSLSSVRLVLTDPLERYSTVVVEIETAAGAGRTTFELDAARPTEVWSPPPLAAAADGYRYRVRTVGTNAEVRQGDWQPGDRSFLVVGDPGLRVAEVGLLLLPTPGLAAAAVRLTSLEPPEGVNPTAEAFLEPGSSPPTLRLPFAATAAASRYRVEGELFFDDGVRPIDPRDSADEILVLP